MELDRIETCHLRHCRVSDSVHDLHVWSIGSDTHSLSCHVAIADMPASESASILAAVRAMLGERFQIHHTTIQFELNVCEVRDGCVIPISSGPHDTVTDILTELGKSTRSVAGIGAGADVATRRERACSDYPGTTPG